MKHFTTFACRYGLILCLALYCIFSLSSFSTYGQAITGSPLNEEVIKIDTTTLKASKRVPFDRPFILEMEIKEGAAIKNIFLYRVKMNDRKVDTNDDGIPDEVKPVRELADKDPKTPIIEPEAVLRFKPGKKTTLNVFVPALEPNSNYDIIVVEAFSGDLLRKLLKVFTLLHIPAAADAITEFSKSLSPNIVEPPVPDIPTRSFYRANITNTNAFYNSNIKILLDNIASISTFPPTFATLSNLKYNLIFPKAQAVKVDSGSLAALYAIKDQPTYEKIVKGFNTLTITKQDDTDDFDYPARLKNIVSSKKAVSRLKLLAANLLLETPNNVDFKNFRDAISELEKLLIDSEKIIDENYKKIIKSIQDNPIYRYGNLLAATSDFETVQTSSGYYLIPEVGIAHTFPIQRDNTWQYLPKLLLGFNFGFRPIDKNLKVSYIPPGSRFWYRTSLTLAVTVQPIKDPEFGDFFNNTSLFVGINYRINRSIRVEAGPFFLRRKNINPLISKQSIIGAPFVALSFDIDVMQAINRLTNRFF